MRKMAYLLVILMMATVLALSGCAKKEAPTPAPAPAPARELRPETITFGAMLPGAATYIWANAMASVISEYSDLKFTVEPYACNTLAMRLFKSERVQMVTGPIFDASAAARGLGR